MPRNGKPGVWPTGRKSKADLQEMARAEREAKATLKVAEEHEEVQSRDGTTLDLNVVKGLSKRKAPPTGFEKPVNIETALKEFDTRASAAPTIPIPTSTPGSSLTNKQRLDLLREINRRRRLAIYKADFAKFAEEQIKILPKDVRRGFIPFKFNRAQAIIHKAIESQRKQRGLVRVVILKARQMGVSSYTTARVFWRAYFNAYHKSVVMAHDILTSDYLFSMSKSIIANMPEEFRPESKKSNAKEIVFEHNESGYRLYTAGSPDAGRGTTPTIAHLSEVAFWQHADKILAGLFQGIPEVPDTEVIIESTANGIGNPYHTLWLDAVAGRNDYLAIFVPWFLMDEYKRKPPNYFSLTADEKRLQKQFGADTLTNDRLYWRRLKIAESGLDNFKQEYPSTPEEAFIATGTSVFKPEKLQKYITIAPKKQFTFDFEFLNFELVSEKGNLEVFDPPKYNECFAIGADVSLGVGRDYSTATVLDVDRRVRAVFRDNSIDPSKFGDLLFYLGRMFNNALLGVECNSMGIATLNRLVEMKYMNLYYQTKVAQANLEPTERIGWRTTTATKPPLIGFLKNAIENFDIEINSRILLDEASTYITLENGQTGASPGSYDDVLMSTAIALEIIRTNGNKLTNNRIPFSQRTGSNEPAGNETVWL